MKLTTIFLVGLLFASAAQAAMPQHITKIWFTILATRHSLPDALAAAKDLRVLETDNVELVATADCRNMQDGLYIVTAGIAPSAHAAQATTATWRAMGVLDAYAKRCDAEIPSRVSAGIPMLDPSIVEKTVSAVNWDLEDTLSEVKGLSDVIYAIVQPRWEYAPEDVREGLRTAVSVRDIRRPLPITLSSDCIDPVFVLGETLLALTCVSGAAAENLLHRTTLYALGNGAIVAQVDRCRMPVLAAGRWICQRESVNVNGELILTAIDLLD